MGSWVPPQQTYILLQFSSDSENFLAKIFSINLHIFSTYAFIYKLMKFVKRPNTSVFDFLLHFVGTRKVRWKFYIPHSTQFILKSDNSW